MKVGLEVHQQLATGKLFCACPSELSEHVTATILRRLRPTGGENHAIDPAVAFEAARGRVFRYEATASDCLVEVDEEPPHALNPEALEVGLTLARLLRASPLDEIIVMRKIVIDGSNTTGFQRTALLAVDGTLEVAGRSYRIPTICLEEDSARKVGEGAGEGRFRLDRLGIPLLEIATAPEITEGAEARAVATEIGALLRATRRVRRGIGTIREDLNVSTPGGTRIEIKGVQELRLIQKYVEQEADRQQMLLALREELRSRGAGSIPEGFVDVTGVLRGLPSGPLRDVGKAGAVALALRLPGFGGLLGPRPGTEERLGRELADYARAAGLRGLLHSDELPGYGLDAGHVERLRHALGAAEADAFVVVTAPAEAQARRALEQVRERAALALEGIPAETRDPLPDGRTRYSRPLPGRDRMYPETDVAPIPLDPERWEALGETLPELPAATRARIGRTHGLHAEVVRQLQQDDQLERFEALVARGFGASAVARLLTQDFSEAGVDRLEGAYAPTDDDLAAILTALAAGRFAKEGTAKVLRSLSEGPGAVERAIAAAGLEPLSRAELEALAQEVLAQGEAMIRERGARALSPLMGDLMRRVRGRRDGREVAEVLEAALRARLKPQAAGGSR